MIYQKCCPFCSSRKYQMEIGIVCSALAKSVARGWMKRRLYYLLECGNAPSAKICIMKLCVEERRSKLDIAFDTWCCSATCQGVYLGLQANIGHPILLLMDFAGHF